MVSFSLGLPAWWYWWGLEGHNMDPLRPDCPTTRVPPSQSHETGPGEQPKRRGLVSLSLGQSLVSSVWRTSCALSMSFQCPFNVFSCVFSTTVRVVGHATHGRKSSDVEGQLDENQIPSAFPWCHVMSRCRMSAISICPQAHSVITAPKKNITHDSWSLIFAARQSAFCASKSHHEQFSMLVREILNFLLYSVVFLWIAIQFHSLNQSKVARPWSTVATGCYRMLRGYKNTKLLGIESLTNIDTESTYDPHGNLLVALTGGKQSHWSNMSRIS